MPTIQVKQNLSSVKAIERAKRKAAGDSSEEGETTGTKSVASILGRKSPTKRHASQEYI